MTNLSKNSNFIDLHKNCIFDNFNKRYLTKYVTPMYPQL